MGELIRIPLTGEVVGFDKQAYLLDNIGVSGNPNKPIQPINVLKDLRLLWKLIEIDLENDEAVIEINPLETISELKTGGNPLNADDYNIRTLTVQEKQAGIDKAKAAVSKLQSQLYAESGNPPLVKTPAQVNAFKIAKAERDARAQ